MMCLLIMTTLLSGFVRSFHTRTTTRLPFSTTYWSNGNHVHPPLQQQQQPRITRRHPLSATLINKDSEVSKGGSDVPDELLEVWEAEEIEEQRREVEDKIQEARDKGTEDELPEYMLRLLEQFSEHDSDYDNSDPVQASSLPIIAVIGRPNTGKSTIVNRLTNSYKDGAIVHDEPGITRDRTYRAGMWNDYNFQVVDTGGIVFDDVEDIFADKITQQALLALSEATAAMMVCDGKEGVNPLDQVLASWLRKNNKIPLYLAVNKCESETQGIAQAQDFWSLGLDQPYPVSGIHGTGLGDLLDEITSKNMAKVTKVLKENATNIAFIGRPNVGKSSLFNRLLGTDRSIVSDVAGTTRDTVDAMVERGGAKYRIVDTAGIRKKGKIEYGAEFFMVGRAFKAIRRAEVVVLLLGELQWGGVGWCCCRVAWRHCIPDTWFSLLPYIRC